MHDCNKIYIKIYYFIITYDIFLFVSWPAAVSSFLAADLYSLDKSQGIVESLSATEQNLEKEFVMCNMDYKLEKT